MEELRKDDLLRVNDIRHVNHDGVDYFCIEDVVRYLQEDMRMIRSTKLSYEGRELHFATVEQIEKSRFKQPLTDFDKMLLRSRKI